MMVTDVAISLSRKKEDKVNGTGRFHIMKNRYGTDGMTYHAKIDTSTGHFEILDEYDEEVSTPPQTNGFRNIDSIDKALIKQRFFELQN
jgi:hypothetical protein